MSKENGSSPASRLNVWLNAVVGVGTVIGFFISVLILTSTVTQKFTEVSADVKSVSSKVDSASTLAQAKVDALSDTVKRNSDDVKTFQTTVTDAFKRVFDSQQKLTDALNQERVERLTQQATKSK